MLLIKTMQFDELLKSRYSCRHFSIVNGKPEKISLDKLIEICNAARLTPMAGNIYSIKLILVTDREKIIKLAQASMQSWVANAYAIIVVCTDGKQTRIAYGKDAERYLPQQAGAAIQNMLLKATELGIGSCWVGAFYEEKVKEILGIPDDIKVEAMVVLGMPTKNKLKKRLLKQKPKPELRNILYFDKWKGKRYKEKVPGA